MTSLLIAWYNAHYLSKTSTYKHIFLFILLSSAHLLLQFIHFLYYVSTVAANYIMNFDDSFMKQQSVSVLTQKNCDQWFTLIKRWLIDEDLWSVIETSAVNTSVSDFFFSLSNLDFKNQKINVKVLYWLTICINADDQEYLTDKINAKKA